jgi:hypothetical protein
MKINDILINEIKKGKKKRKNGLRVMSLDDFLRNNLTEAPLGLGAQTTPFPEDEMQDYLNRIKTKSKEKRDKFKNPYVHGSNIKIKDESGNTYDTADLKKQITTRPDNILKQNSKMKHSDGSEQIFYNIGLPALRGLAVDEDTGEFVIVNTCPGAGECKLYCYAMKGGYIQYPDSSKNHAQVLNFLLNDPEGFENKLSSEISSLDNGEPGRIAIRWHDDGDFFSPQYLDMAFRVAKKFPNVDFYAYTKVSDAFKAKAPDNFIMNFSKGALNKEEKRINFEDEKHSVVVPKSLFNDLIKKDGRKMVRDEEGKMMFKNKQALQDFKQRLSDHYGIDINTILTYNEMMKNLKNLGDKPKWNVIVRPKEGDNSANHRGVLGTYLMFH